jgi:hypothetical protein
MTTKKKPAPPAKPATAPMLTSLGEPLWVPVGRITEYDQNPRVNQPVDQVAESIRTLGWTNPIIVDADFVIICGHTRYRAARDVLKLDKVPVLVADHWTDAQVRAYRLADNRLAEQADWDYGFLKLELDALSAEGFNPDSMGFDDAFLAALSGKKPEVLSPDEPAGDVDTLVDELYLFAQAGDLFELGPHRLECGDGEQACLILKKIAKAFPRLPISRNGEPFTVPV